MRRVRGFTLIELMVVVGIVGILAAIATGAYVDYVRTSQAAKVSANYRVALDSVTFIYANAQVDHSQGRIPNPAIPDTDAGWLALIDFEAKPAPGGGPAFVAGAGSATTGAIGIAALGSWAGGDSEVTITRPAYADLASESVVVTMHQ
jgi:prepilin-type N-terminal cleavage/methylation domain-containing protein